MKLALSYDALSAAIKLSMPGRLDGRTRRIYGVPRGGIFAALMATAADPKMTVIEDPEYADLIIDDIIDTGRTAKRYNPDTPFFAIVGRNGVQYADNVVVGMRVPADVWVTFPWENEEEKRLQDDTIVGTLRNRFRAEGVSFLANDNISEHLENHELEMLEAEVVVRVRSLLDALLIDTENDHNSRDTAKRVAKMFLHESFAGRYTPRPRVTSFPNVRELDELYTTGPITIRSTCSHHFAPILGQCWIGVIPGKNVIGLSKFNRLVDWVLCRPQIQEEAAVMLADLLEEVMEPKGLAIVIKATHTCMTQRGVREAPDAKMTTSVMRGLLRDQPEARAEFLELIK